MMMKRLGIVQKERILENRGRFLDTKIWRKE
jgi:hypothetical protein